MARKEDSSASIFQLSCCSSVFSVFLSSVRLFFPLNLFASQARNSLPRMFFFTFIFQFACLLLPIDRFLQTLCVCDNRQLTAAMQRFPCRQYPYLLLLPNRKVTFGRPSLILLSVTAAVTVTLFAD